MKFKYIKNLLWIFFKRLSTLNFSIFILLLIAICSVLGSIIEQDQSLSYYKTYYPVCSFTSCVINWQLIYFLGLDHVYQTWWFIFILLLFMLSLITCTFSTQLPNFKNARRWKFIFYTNSKNHKYSFADNSHTTSNTLTNIIFPLVNSNFFVFHKKYSVYSYKGLYGRIAPIFVHFGIIITLLGSILSFFSGFVSQEMIPSGELFHVKNVVRSGFYSKLPVDLYGRVDSFYVTYNSDNSIKQFFSNVSLFKHSEEVIASHLISVNSPLTFKNITFYQTDWQINALRIKLGSNNFIQKKLVKASINNKSCWLCKIPVSTNQQIFLVLFSLDDSIFICNDHGVLTNVINVGENFYINNIPCLIQSVMTSTGLQIKVDYGIFVVYLGFFLVILSTFFSYLSYSQIWAHMFPQTLQCMGSTNRAILFFEEDLYKINSYYSYYMSNFSISSASVINKILR